MFRRTKKQRVMVTLPIKVLRKQFFHTSRKVFCLKPAKCSKNLLPKNDPSDKNNWVLITIRIFTAYSPRVLRSYSERKNAKVIIWTRRKHFWQISRSFLAQTRKIVQKTTSEQRFVGQVERIFDKPAQNFLLKIRESSAQNQKKISEVFFSIRSIQFIKHLANCSLKFRQKIIQRRERLRNFLDQITPMYL